MGKDPCISSFAFVAACFFVLYTNSRFALNSGSETSLEASIGSRDWPPYHPQVVVLRNAPLTTRNTQSASAEPQSWAKTIVAGKSKKIAKVGMFFSD